MGTASGTTQMTDVWPNSPALQTFVRQSNLIEGIDRDPTAEEINAHVVLLNAPYVGVTELERFVADVQPGATIRDQPGMNVYVGSHVPPPGGPEIRTELLWILDRAHTGTDTFYETHLLYETLHPFMDGNGRSGRALYAWQSLRADRDRFLSLPLGFLHEWYYQSLNHGRRGIKM